MRIAKVRIVWAPGPALFTLYDDQGTVIAQNSVQIEPQRHELLINVRVPDEEEK